MDHRQPGDRRREERVIRFCQRATELDPDYARAWALLSIAPSNLRFGFELSVDDGVAAGERALELDPSIAEAHCAKARRLAEAGHYDEAEEEIAAALRLDPDSWEANKDAGRLRKAQRRMAEARAHYEKAVAAVESDFHAWALLVSCCEALGEKASARHAAEMALPHAEAALAEDPTNGFALGVAAAVLVYLGQADRARDRIERAFLIGPDNLNMRLNFVCAYALSGDPQSALDMLKPVLEVAGRNIVALCETDPDLDSLRGDPRFQKMLREAEERLAIEPRRAAIPAAT